MSLTPDLSINQLLHILDASQDLISYVDMDYVYQYVNSAYLKYWQKTHEMIVGRNVVELMGVEAFQQTLEKHLLACLEGETVRYDSWFDYPAMGKRFMNVAYTPARDDAGAVCGILVSVRDMTDIRHFSDYYEHMFTQSPDMHCLLDYAGRFRRVNPAWERTLGWDDSRLIGTAVTAFLDEEDQKVFATRLATLTASVSSGSNQDDTPLILEHRFENGFGNRTWLAWHITPMVNEPLLVATARDISEQKATDILNSELMGQAKLLHLIDTLMVTTDSVEEIARLIADALVSMLGCDRVLVLLDDAKKETCRLVAESDFNMQMGSVDLVFPIYQDELAEAALEAGEVFICEDADTLTDLLPVQQYLYDKGMRAFMCLPLITEEGMLGVMFVAWNKAHHISWQHRQIAAEIVTQLAVALYQFQLKARLAEEGRMLRTLIDHIPDYIFIKDAEGRFLISNIAHAAAVDLLPEDLIQKTAEEVFASDLAPQFYEDDLAVIESGEALINEERITSSTDNQLIHVLTTKVPLRNERDEIIGLVGISRDITDRKYAEASRLEAAQLRMALEKERVKLEKEKEVSDLKSHFIMTVSHEFRTPLTIIQTSTQLLHRHLERMDKEKRQSLLERIQEQTRHMTRMIDETLLAGQAQISRIPFNPTNVPIVVFCESTFDQMKTIDHERHEFVFESTLAADVEVQLDAGLFREVLLNLLSNAIRYTPAYKSIALRLSRAADTLVVVVEDEGIGITAENQTQIFDSFYRGDNVGKVAGTGLGLFIARTYVEIHDGTIQCESEPGKGTCFTIRLPVFAG